MAAEFVALADLLRPPAAVAEPNDIRPHDVMATESHSIAGDRADVGTGDETYGVVHDTVRDGVRDALRDARLFRARLADAFDDAAARLLRELASDVLARELRLAPCDLAAIARRVAERAPVVRVRVAACDVAGAGDAPLFRGGDIAVLADPALAAGDAIVELASGALDARLGVRLAAVLEAFA